MSSVKLKDILNKDRMFPPVWWFVELVKLTHEGKISFTAGKQIINYWYEKEKEICLKS